MIFDVITLFPEVLKSYFSESILGRASRNKFIKINLHNLRDFSIDKKHRKVDDRVYGGGPGMVLKIEPIVKAVHAITKKNKKSKSKIILLSASGKQFNDKMARQWERNYNRLILICGHYEGIDERVKKIVKAEEISVGPYVLSGGELAAMAVIDAVSRKIDRVLGKAESLEEKRLGIGVPVYTRPEVFIHKKRGYAVPKALLSGDHVRIGKWRLEHKKI